MNEREYISATNIAKLRVCQMILREILPEDAGVEAICPGYLINEFEESTEGGG